MGITCSKSMNQPGKVANPARGQLNRENNTPLSPCVPDHSVSRDGFSRPVPRQPAYLHTQAESSAYLRDSSRVPRRCPFMKPPYAIGSVPSLSGHAIAYRWRSLPRVRLHRARKPQGSSERVLPWQVTMSQLMRASISHTHYWYEEGMLKVPAELPINIKEGFLLLPLYSMQTRKHLLVYQIQTNFLEITVPVKPYRQPRMGSYVRKICPGGRQYAGDAVTQLLCITVVCSYQIMTR